MQPKQEIEDNYKTPDPWGYQTREDDYERRERIRNAARRHCPNKSGMYLKALDIGCGEGWISQYLPALNVHGFELSDNAASRFPVNVLRVTDPQDKYDLVITTGTLYGHYDWQGMTDIIKRCASRIVIVSYIATWELPEAIARIPGKQIEQIEFPYAEYIQRLRVFDLTA